MLKGRKRRRITKELVKKAAASKKKGKK